MVKRSPLSLGLLCCALIFACACSDNAIPETRRSRTTQRPAPGKSVLVDMLVDAIKSRDAPAKPRLANSPVGHTDPKPAPKEDTPSQSRLSALFGLMKSPQNPQPKNAAAAAGSSTPDAPEATPDATPKPAKKGPRRRVSRRWRAADRSFTPNGTQKRSSTVTSITTGQFEAWFEVPGNLRPGESAVGYAIVRAAPGNSFRRGSGRFIVRGSKGVTLPGTKFSRARYSGWTMKVKVPFTAGPAGVARIQGVQHFTICEAGGACSRYKFKKSVTFRIG